MEIPRFPWGLMERERDLNSVTAFQNSQAPLDSTLEGYKRGTWKEPRARVQTPGPTRRRQSARVTAVGRITWDGCLQYVERRDDPDRRVGTLVHAVGEHQRG
jgi:hypothetical protein